MNPEIASALEATAAEVAPLVISAGETALETALEKLLTPLVAELLKGEEDVLAKAIQIETAIGNAMQAAITKITEDKSEAEAEAEETAKFPGQPW